MDNPFEQSKKKSDIFNSKRQVSKTLKIFPIICGLLILLILIKSCNSIQDNENTISFTTESDTTSLFDTDQSDVSSEEVPEDNAESDDVVATTEPVDVVEFLKETDDFFTNIDQTGEYYEVMVDPVLAINVGVDEELKPGYYQVDLIKQEQDDYNSVYFEITNENLDYSNPLGYYSYYSDSDSTKTMMYLKEGDVLTLDPDDAMTFKFNPINVEANIDSFMKEDSGIYFGNEPLTIPVSAKYDPGFYKIEIYEYNENQEWVYHSIDLWDLEYETGPERYDTKTESIRKYKEEDNYVFEYDNPYIVFVEQ